TPVRGGWLPRRGQGEEPQLRQEPRLRDLGAGAVTRSGSFEDHFSEIAAAYAAHRPSYPAALVDFLARLAPGTRLAWDAGCGSGQDRKSTRLNSSHVSSSYAVFCLKKK